MESVLPADPVNEKEEERGQVEEEQRVNLCGAVSVTQVKQLVQEWMATTPSKQMTLHFLNVQCQG